MIKSTLLICLNGVYLLGFVSFSCLFVYVPPGVQVKGKKSEFVCPGNGELIRICQVFCSFVDSVLCMLFVNVC